MSEKSDSRKKMNEEEDEVGELIWSEERREEKERGERDESLERWEVR